jgi:hypothetical protein
MILELLPFYKKERINYKCELEKNKIEYKKLKSDIKEKHRIALENLELKESPKNKKKWYNLFSKDKQKKEVNKFFKKEFESLERTNKRLKLTAKINFMSAVSEHKKKKEDIKLTKKSKSNLHQMLYEYSNLPYHEKKQSLVVGEIAPSRELVYGIKKRIFNDLNAFTDKDNDRVYAGEKDILFMNISLSSGNQKIPVVFRYSGECVPIYLEKIRDDTFDKFSTENEHHIMMLSERLREIKAPNKFNFKLGKTASMILIATVIMIGYLIYKYYKGGF